MRHTSTLAQQRGVTRARDRGALSDITPWACAQTWAPTQYSLRIARKVIPESLSNFSPFIVYIGSIINVYVQYVGSSVIHNVESWCARHDLFHLLNTLRVIQNFTLSIWSEQDHRAVAAALMHRQNCTFCVSDIKIDLHGAASSVGERIITLDAVMLQRFTEHTLQIHTVMDFLSELTSQNPLGTWTQHFQSQQLVDHLDIYRRKAPLRLTDRIFHECPLAPQSHQKLSSTNLAIPSDVFDHSRMSLCNGP